ncbi:MAG: NapC/NirT family cytochrome c [Anaerolineales bacterium]|nr:NapC/NirT family cytochrome c [Anaerolineales bacterium]
MRKLFSAIKRFFFPPAGSPLWVRTLPFIILGILTISLISGTVYGWTYTNSSVFCGTTCHTMPPEYSAYQRSPHARVQCVECHIGRDVVTTQFSRKAGDLRHVYLTLTQDYEFPIFSRAMRPARESCETCHFPEKFSDDSLREIKTYGNDAENSPESLYLVLKTGGGSKREGLGRGIHWHVENEVWYLATDALEQNIPYVRTVDEEGNVTEYYDIASGITPDDIAGTFLERMDCISCHNRITHSIPTPEEAVDQALSKGLISPELLYVRDEAVALLSVKYESLTEADEAFATLPDFYAENYPDLYEAQQDAIQETVGVLQDMYVQMVFPEQELDWETHPDNLGHKNSPGCFRCHDGKHLTGTEEAIRLECNLCHSVPVTADNSLVANIEIAQGPEPTSHTHNSWIALHGRSIDSSCASCHTPADSSVDYTQLEGKPPADGSFCGNVACHANEWVYAGFDDPALEPVLARQLYILLNTSPYLLDGVPRTYEGTFKAMFDGRCTFCHSGPQAEAGLDLSSYESAMRGSDDGPVIIAGDAETSLLVQRQSGPIEHFGQLLAEELTAVKEWIAAGAPEK